MKSREEIEQLANEYAKQFDYAEDSSPFLDYIEGYTQCQEDMTDKKYTEEDIRKVIDETLKACNIAQKESYGDLEIDTNKIINSLNKQD